LNSNLEKSDDHQCRVGRNHFVPSDPDLHHATGRDQGETNCLAL
jgi:hypothetical protein